jgi:hypothetical protein
MTQYVIQHEGIADIEVPPEVALDDATLATSLAPFIDGASTAKFQRSEEKDGKVIITVIKQSQKKGSGLDAVLTALVDAPQRRNPVAQMYQDLSGVRLADMQPDQVILLQERIAEIVDEGERQNAMMAAGITRLTMVPAQPYTALVTGF